MNIAALRRRLLMGRKFGRIGDAVPRSGSVRFTRTAGANAVLTGRIAQPVERIMAKDVPLLVPSGAQLGGVDILVPPASGGELTPIERPTLPSNTLPSGQQVQTAMNFTTTPTFGSGIQSDLINKGIDAGVQILSGLLNRPKTGQTSIGGMIGRGGTVAPRGSALEAETLRLLGLAPQTGKDVLLPAGARKKYRHMNVANVRALRRAARRLEGFEKLAKKTLTLTARVHVKKKRRR